VEDGGYQTFMPNFRVDESNQVIESSGDMRQPASAAPRGGWTTMACRGPDRPDAETTRCRHRLRCAIRSLRRDGPLVAVAHRVGLVALLAVLADRPAPRPWPPRVVQDQRVGAGVILGRNTLPAGTGNRAHSHRRARARNQKNCSGSVASLRAAPPWEP
jgi:hypothetical protein